MAFCVRCNGLGAFSSHAAAPVTLCTGCNGTGDTDNRIPVKKYSQEQLARAETRRKIEIIQEARELGEELSEVWD